MIETLNYMGKDYDIDKMDINGLKEVIKILMRLMNYEHDRLTALQDRVLDLERGKQWDYSAKRRMKRHKSDT